MTVTPILLYHSVTEQAPPGLDRFTVTPTAFRAHLDAVVRTGLLPVTIPELVDARARGHVEGMVAITFDDGFADFAEHAAPLLAEHELPSTLYVTTGALRNGPQQQAPHPFPDASMLAWDDLPGLEAAGVAIGAHGHTHPQLDLLGDRRLTEEIVTSRDLLAAALGHEVTTFAYPHGYASGRVRRATAAAGFSSACGVRNALSPDGDDPLCLARLTVGADLAADQLAAWLDGRLAPVATAGEAWRTKTWRLARRLHRRCAVTATRRMGSASEGAR